MPNSKTRFDDLIAALRARDFRLTPQRIELVRLIAVSEGHPSASQLYAKIRDRFPTMSPATVYKTLALLKEMDQVLEIALHDDSHYDGKRLDPHSHLICTKCSKIVDGDVNLEVATIRKLEQASGFHITRPQLAFYGLCPDCRQTSK